MNWSDNPNRRFLDVKEAAEYLGLATSTLYTMVSQRRVPFVKMGSRTKFNVKDIDAWIKQHTVKAHSQGLDGDVPYVEH